MTVADFSWSLSSTKQRQIMQNWCNMTWWQNILTRTRFWNLTDIENLEEIIVQINKRYSFYSYSSIIQWK